MKRLHTSTIIARSRTNPFRDGLLEERQVTVQEAERSLIDRRNSLTQNAFIPVAHPALVQHSDDQRTEGHNSGRAQILPTMSLLMLALVTYGLVTIEAGLLHLTARFET